MSTIDKVILKDGKTYDFSPNKKELYLTFLENNESNRLLLKEISNIEDNETIMAWLPENIGVWLDENIIRFLMGWKMSTALDILKKFFPNLEKKKSGILTDMNENELQTFALIFFLINLKNVANVIVLDNIDEKLGNIKNVLLDILKEVHKEIGVKYQYFILTNDKIFNMKG